MEHVFQVKRSRFYSATIIFQRKHSQILCCYCLFLFAYLYFIYFLEESSTAF